MSGLNPFRPRKPESEFDPPLPACWDSQGSMLTVVDPSIHHSSPTTSTSAKPAFPTLPSSNTTSQNALFQPNGLAGTPPTSHVPDLDDTMSSDDQSVSDPFHQGIHLSEDDMEDREGSLSSSTWDTPKSRGGDCLQESLDSTGPHTDPYISQPAPAVPTTQSIRQTGRASNEECPRESENDKVSRNTTSRSSYHSGTRTANNCTTSVPQSTSRIDISNQVAAGDYMPTIDAEARPLVSRSGNRERIPPPPPRSHHGKLINPSPGSTPPSPQPAPSKPANRFSFHGSPPESSSSPKPSQSGVDYITETANSEAKKSSEPLRRSQSQYKRPPTPPLSRRHSQMRRSKTTASKPNPSRLSMPAVGMEGTESPPPSPSSWSLNPSRTRDTRPGPSSEENPRRPSLQHQSAGAVTSTPSTDASVPSSQSTSRTPSMKRASIGNPLPPPPPPRRTRGSSSQSNDSTRPTSLYSEKRPEVHGEYIPHPSNASDILADLSRLQKEVDDLRVHYETRKASH
ncbi:hypothetical protein COH20_006083 [Aspergillus flavus]|uniref:Unnamed protein product n=3 Tax=Aspergillus subgen. Circumdati TaxID=2720871 RepID=A0A1S9DIF7_ASPOZ|nr:uncharacterized protein G4B84_009512 [Aspergillus flavus NRRL3357]KAJ1709977.1 hypothetical protein NYO67_7873 [Aspergillus flavus]OOO08851.1 hypothetical protein OAory_01101470 [Aspergillus oryzae]GMG41127.1 unnamed protein product [Aspergillus oryzae var. brunneus]QMW34046.1 hypothetical protein G4B84_009512 [Aspergillus flavus NRRL3357]QMW46101.1 hypothetical protein G4B11_009556 [Aspergillus flavus]